MTTFPNSPRLLKGGIILVDPETAAVLKVIALQLDFRREKIEETF